MSPARNLLPAFAIALAAAAPAHAAGGLKDNGQNLELVFINALPVAVARRALPAKGITEAIIVVDGKAYAIAKTGADSWKTTSGMPKLHGAKAISFKEKSTHGIIVINGTPLLHEGPPPAPDARTATLVGADGKRLTITKIGPGQWQTTSGPLPGLYHYRVVVTDEAGNVGAGPKASPGLGAKTGPDPMNEMPGKPKMVAPGPPDADKVRPMMQAPGPPDATKGPAQGGPDIKSPSLAAPKLPQSGAGDGKFTIKGLPGRAK